MKTKILADFEICLSEPLMLVMVILPGIYLFKVNNGNTKTMCKICSKLTMKTLERCLWQTEL